MSRMTPERLAEIEEKERIHFPDGSMAYTAKSYLTEELMQALKAEREKVKELEADRRNLLDNDLKARICVEQQQEIIDLKARLQRVGELADEAASC